MLCNRFVYLSEFELKLRNINTCAMLSSMRHTVSRIKLSSCACRKFSEAMMVRATMRYRARDSIIHPADQTGIWSGPITAEWREG